MATYTANDLHALPTLHQGHCCNLKIETADRRVWLCRVESGVTIERLIHGRWVAVDGSCTAYEASDPAKSELTREECQTDARLRRRGF